MRRCLVIQHEPDGPVGLAGERLAHHGYELHPVLVMQSTGDGHSDVVFPDPKEFDFVVSLGSVQGVYDRDAIGSWIDAELACLRAAHDHGVPILGICFGGQALAAALGGTVEKAPGHEIGWYELESLAPEIPAGPWFVWHIDRFTVPPGATELARTGLCPHAFRLGRSVGLQFHPEADEVILKTWVASCGDEYFAAKEVERDSLYGGPERHARARESFFRMIDWMVDEVAGSPVVSS
jgi:GMP synthase-like glutamine amidotransferase